MNQAIGGEEEAKIHTRMLRIGLAVEDSRAYWQRAGTLDDENDRIHTAFEERWFGSRTMARVRYLVNNFKYRFDAFPDSLPVLHRWNPSDIADRTVICHWHVQLTDPLYREFTSTLFNLRWHRPEPTIDRSSALRWVEEKTDGRWSSSTSQRMATGLLACAADANLCEETKRVRTLSYPRVSDLALSYLLYLLKDVEYEGSLKSNPYALSVGLDGELWEQRVRNLPSVHYRRMADVHDLEWKFESLSHWGKETFSDD